ncbi:hypothetical protein KKJ06_22955, partial [Xenorhabdus bovienii]|uniref:hypothetical protein n=1 Tax=Xenorhabdus bovienii TaxID=40576 RepID=UPI0023B32A43
AQANDHRERVRTGEGSILIFERSDVAFVTKNVDMSKKIIKRDDTRKEYFSLALPQICGNSESGVNASSLQAMLFSYSNGSMPLL